jgi:DNA-binding NtrC family response regulator
LDFQTPGGSMKQKIEKPRWVKRTVVLREDFAERLRREAFYGRRQMREIVDDALAAWFGTHPERPVLDVRPIAEQAADFKVEAVRAAMAANGYNRQAAAQALGISRVQLWRLCEQYGLEFPRGKREK